MKYTRAGFREAIQTSNHERLVELLIEHPPSIKWLTTSFSKEEPRNPLDFKAATAETENDLTTVKVLHAFSPAHLTYPIFGSFDDSILAQPPLEAVLSYSEEVNSICYEDKATLKNKFIKDYTFERAIQQMFILTGIRSEKKEGTIYPESKVKGEHLRFSFTADDKTHDRVFATLLFFQLAPGRGTKPASPDGSCPESHLVMLHPDEIERLNYYFSNTKEPQIFPRRSLAVEKLSSSIQEEITQIILSASLSNDIIRRNNGQYDIKNLFSSFVDLLMDSCPWFLHLKSSGIRFECKSPREGEAPYNEAPDCDEAPVDYLPHYNLTNGREEINAISSPTASSSNCTRQDTKRQKI